MPLPHRLSQFFRPSLSFALFGILLASLWLAGGASRPDALGQVVVRSVSWAILVIAILFGPRPSFGTAKPILIFLILALGLALMQLLPLPPTLWQALPGRSLLAEAASASGQPQPWRQWSMAPSVTLNAASSLVVPFVTLLLISQLTESERFTMPGILLFFVGASAIVAMLQFSSLGYNNIFVNDTPGTVSGTFANRNHFALLLSIGCLLAPVWAVMPKRKLLWRTILAGGLVLLFLLMILGTGSRAGLALGTIGVSLGLLISARAIRRALTRYPSWAFPAMMAGILGTIALGVLVSVVAGRAVSIDRMVAMDQGQDMRMRGLPTVLAMIREYFPAGTGLGTFDPIFRLHEPTALLKPTYFNHAHNDFLEVVLTAGLPGLLLLVAALGWWAWASFRAWRTWGEGAEVLPKLGSTALLLVLFASVFDYPARTPTIMALVVIAAVWLAGPVRSPALPSKRALL
nr:O-antigen ligase family protein [uncultured Sphingomonas sp.]